LRNSDKNISGKISYSPEVSKTKSYNPFILSGVISQSRLIENLKNVFFRIWYWYINTIDKDAEVTFMNYGYSKDNQKIKLDETDEKNRYSIQLYNYVATGTDIKGKTVLEVGCGRGGGLSYINRYLLPGEATGVDLNKKAVKFCKTHYSNEKIKFIQANAQNLNFQDKSFDVVLNIESSHRYSKINLFLLEVYRVLKPDGVFLFADFKNKVELEKLNKLLEKLNFKLIKKEKITSNVLEALNLSKVQREKLIYKIAPTIFHGLGKKFAATEGTPTYNKFLTREFEYVYYILKKY
jgi:ubiquinone/menaquinone biosynthesis C-methylase UbiE